MSKLITLSIDETQIDKSRLKEFTRRNGNFGKSLELVIFETKAGKLLVKQSVTKEEREAGVEMPILGEAKEWQPKQSGGTSLKHTSPNEAASDEPPF
jgi:hypothetical protein